MIQSGRTQQASSELASWYNGEYGFVRDNTEWDWGVNKESLQKLLDTRSGIPFRDFMIRYVLYVHEDDFRKMEAAGDGAGPAEKDWLVRKGREVTAMAAEAFDLHQTYDLAPPFLRAMTDLVFQDFVDNRFCIAEKGGEVQYVLGSTAKHSRVRWDKNALLERLICDTIRQGELIAFAFGMNMSFESLEFFLQKALNRPGLDVWKPEEFLLYLSFKYADWDRYDFWTSLSKIYAALETNGNKSSWLNDGQISTRAITKKTLDLLPALDEMRLSFTLGHKGELPRGVMEFLREYKRFIQDPGDYSRTAVREMQRLIAEFEESAGEDIEAAANASRDPGGVKDFLADTGERVSQGKIEILYTPGEGLSVPKGTVFIKRSQGREVHFVSEEDILIPPRSGDPLRDVRIDVISEKREPRLADKKQLQGYIPKNTVFSSNCKDLSEMYNKSGFKGLGESGTAMGDYIHTGGKIYAKCREGARIPAGTRFSALNAGGERIYFQSRGDVEVRASVQIHVHCLETEEVAEKNTIKDCSIPGWEQHFEIRNSKIGYRQKQEKGNKEGKLCGYLYPAVPGEWEYEDVLDEQYVKKLGGILEGTKLNATKISNIKAGRNASSVTRSDLITFSFLTYMSRLEKKRLEEGREAVSDFGKAYPEESGAAAASGTDRFGGFIAETNRVLARCGFYELYRPNPYDALILYLVSSSEAVDAFRNLWAWYLAKSGKNQG